MTEKTERVRRGRRLLRVAALGAAVVFGAAFVAPGQSAVAAPQPDGGRGFTLPDGAPAPVGGFRVLSAYRVLIGFQIYSCVTAAGGSSAWSTPTSRPEALLLRYGGLRAVHHYAGPRWTSLADGSTLVGTVQTKVARDGTIPWLLLTTTHENSAPGRELDAVTHISRVNTSGGVGPTGACNPATDTDRWVRYGADYVFWVPA